MQKADKTAKLNDLFRTKEGQHLGEWQYTSCVDNHVPLYLFPRLRRKIARYKRFTAANDPKRERRSGAFDLGEERIVWKIDYYDKVSRALTDDASDPEKTTRLLIVMLVGEARRLVETGEMQPHQL